MNKRNKATVDGVRAVELFYRSIKETSSGNNAFFHSEIRLNTLSMGTLLPEHYLKVLENSERCIAIFKLAFTQLLQAMEKFDNKSIDYRWFSIYMPVRFLEIENAVTQITKICDDCGILYDKVCFEISPDILGNSDDSIIRNFNNLRNTGFHFIITGFGGDFFSILKLGDFLPDYLMISPSAPLIISKNERSQECVKILCDSAIALGAEPIVDNVSENSQLGLLKKLGFPYYTGSIVGGFLSEKNLASNYDKY